MTMMWVKTQEGVLNLEYVRKLSIVQVNPQEAERYVLLADTINGTQREQTTLREGSHEECQEALDAITRRVS
jgi:hypothetical protein